MGRTKGTKNIMHIPEELRTVHKSISLRVCEWQALGEQPGKKAAEILRQWIERNRANFSEILNPHS